MSESVASSRLVGAAFVAFVLAAFVFTAACSDKSTASAPTKGQTGSGGHEQAASAPDKTAPPAADVGKPAGNVGTAPPASPGSSSDCTCEDYEQSNIEVFHRMAPATVFVTQKQLVRDYWRMRTTEVAAGTGSGFIWDDDGHIVTNFHVVANAASLSVTLIDGSEHPAELVGGDPNRDVAVLRIDLGKSKAATAHVELTDVDEKLSVGQTTIAIGNPFGLDHTMTVGVVSALNREVKGFGGVTIRSMIQTDASINPGNSGGPLLDRHGRLIGMNTMIYSKVGQSSGIGFAVPTAILRRLVPQIITYGKPRRVGLGIELVSDVLAHRYGISGVVIAAVRNGGPADKAGLRGLRRGPRGSIVGDIIVAIDGAPITGYDDLFNALDGRKPGDVAKVTVDRDGARVDAEVSLALIQ